MSATIVAILCGIVAIVYGIVTSQQVLRQPAHEYTRTLLAAVPRLRPA